jgi:hypothetical protein
MPEPVDPGPLPLLSVAQIDAHLAFLHAQQRRSSAMPHAWAQAQATQFAQIAELLRSVRQWKQMQGPDGKRISG